MCDSPVTRRVSDSASGSSSPINTRSSQDESMQSPVAVFMPAMALAALRRGWEKVGGIGVFALQSLEHFHISRSLVEQVSLCFRFGSTNNSHVPQESSFNLSEPQFLLVICMFLYIFENSILFQDCCNIHVHVAPSNHLDATSLLMD